MKIGVMSDTHIRVPDDVLEYILTDLLSGAEMTLHAGDIVGSAVLEYLEERGVIAVSGNMDDYEVMGHLPHMRIVRAAGKRIGLIHGWGAREGLQNRIVERFEAPRPDLIVFGHSHVPYWGPVDGVMMFNPGSAGIRGALRGGTVGMIEILGDRIEGKFIPVDR